MSETLSCAPSAHGLVFSKPAPPAGQKVLTPAALCFIAELTQRFGPRIQELLARRRLVQTRLDAGERLGFLPATAALREGTWTIAPQPSALADRRVEITGPVDRKMIINALNSGANVFMADFEDSTSPTWENMITGQANLMEAVRGTLRYIAPDSGKAYQLNAQPALLMIRPRGLHLPEKHLLLEGQPVSGALVDFGLFFFHNATFLHQCQKGPFFYLPKLESHLEARFWNDIFIYAQSAQGLPQGTIKATVLIETLPAAFEMDEILYELREHAAGLNCGRWDYIFSFIKKHRNDPSAIVPDRAHITMDKGFLRAYSLLLIRTCHRRGAHAMGGMAAQIPIKNDPQANEQALAKVRADKLREVSDGHDGTWVAHPALVPIAKEIFDTHLSGKKNQLDSLRENIPITEADLLRIPEGPKTDAGLRHNVRVGVQYLEAWLRGVGCVPLYHLMEDAATAEISRTQIWQWIRHRTVLDDGTPMTKERLRIALGEEMGRVLTELGKERIATGRFEQACELFEQLCCAEALEEFLTLFAYDQLLQNEPSEIPVREL